MVVIKRVKGRMISSPDINSMYIYLQTIKHTCVIEKSYGRLTLDIKMRTAFVYLTQFSTKYLHFQLLLYLVAEVCNYTAYSFLIVTFSFILV
jgi:hypothetical protein